MSLEVSKSEKTVFLVLSILFFVIGLILIFCIYTNRVELVITHKKMFIYITIGLILLGIIFLILYLLSKVHIANTYDCINNKCIENSSGTGEFSSADECQKSGCNKKQKSKTYDCVNNTCIENTKGNGAYLSLKECQKSNCGKIVPPPGSKTYDCSGNNCVENASGNGKYSSIADCQNDGCGNVDPKSTKPLILGYWENWDDKNNYGLQPYCSEIGCPNEDYFQQKTKYYTTINWSFVLLSKFWYGGYDPKQECQKYNLCGTDSVSGKEISCPSCVNSDGTYINFPSDSLYGVPACRTGYSPFISLSTTSDNLSNQLLSARETCRLAHKYGKVFNISFGGWSDCITLKDKESNATLAKLISNTILYTFADGVDLDFEHFTQLSPLSYKDANLQYRTDKDATTQLQLFADLVSKIRTSLNNITNDTWNNEVNKYGNDDYQKKLLNNKPAFTISFTCRYDSFITNDNLKQQFGFTSQTAAEGIQIINFDNNFINNINYVNLMIYDEANITTQITYQSFYQKVVDLTKNYVSASKILCGVEPGKQAGAPDSPFEDSSIPDIGNMVLKQKLGGIFFWAINENSNIQNDFSSYLQPLYKSFGYKESGGGDGDGGGGGGGGGLCAGSGDIHPCAQGNCDTKTNRCVCTDPKCKDPYCNC